MAEQENKQGELFRLDKPEIIKTMFGSFVGKYQRENKDEPIKRISENYENADDAEKELQRQLLIDKYVNKNISEGFVQRR